MRMKARYVTAPELKEAFEADAGARKEKERLEKEKKEKKKLDEEAHDEKGPQFVVSRLELHESLDKLNESFKELDDKLVPPKCAREDDIEDDVVPPKQCKVR
ncbi:hypothetical protein BDR05DRAFT_1006103 [Suillus weaverae]|nr:hypothetical protein BDR05DRAFT_1006103 [Suillus weaverae]